MKLLLLKTLGFNDKLLLLVNEANRFGKLFGGSAQGGEFLLCSAGWCRRMSRY
jgi:hypothetical protein